MEIQYKGANCIFITTKKAKIVIDDNLNSVGLSSVGDKADIVIFTSKMLMNDHAANDAFIIDGPGEYEISEVSVLGIPARAHMDDKDVKSATIYRLAFGTTMVAVVGHIYPELTDKQLEEIGMVDILIVPVGGGGYTLDPQGAEDIIKKIDPKVVIPTHYQQEGVQYEVPQAELEEFVAVSGITPEKTDKLKIKNDIFPDNLVVYAIERS